MSVSRYDRIDPGDARWLPFDMTGRADHREIAIPVDGVTLPGDLGLPESPIGLVIFAHGSGSSRKSPRNRLVADALHAQSCATMLFDLLTDAEASDRHNVFDIDLLARRLGAAAAYMQGHDGTARLARAFFGASTGAAAALVAASSDPAIVGVVSRGGRPDLAGAHLQRITCPVLLIVGSRDEQVLELNRAAERHLAGPHRLDVIDGATHLFEEPGTLEDVATRAANWYREIFDRQ